MDALFCRACYELCERFPKANMPKFVIEAAAAYYRHNVLRMP